MRKIVILGDSENSHIQRWASYLIKKYEVHLISFQKYEIDCVHLHFIKPPKYLIIQNVEYANAGMTSFVRKFGYIFCLNRVRKLINALSPDLLHAHWATSYGLAGAISGYHPYIISTWGIDVIGSSRESWIMKKILEYNLSKADVITATSQMLAKETAKYEYTGKTIHHIPFGVDVTLFRTTPGTKAKNPVCIGTVKALEEKYGIEFLIRAFAKVKVVEPNTRLLIVGEGSLRDKLIELSTELGIADSVEFAGRVPNKEVIKYFHEIDIFVVPSVSKSETFGVAAVEASACSIPVIASNIGGLPEVVLDGKTGILFPPSNIDVLVDNILLLIRSPELRIELGNNGRKYIESKYTLNKCGMQLEKIYNHVINNQN